MERDVRRKDIKLVPIGNSRGIRIPKALIQKYGFTQSVVLEETDKGILLRNKEDDKLSWTDTYKAMAKEDENWDDFDSTLLDGLEDDTIDASKI